MNRLESLFYTKKKPRPAKRGFFTTYTLGASEQTSPVTMAVLFVRHCAWSPIASVHFIKRPIRDAIPQNSQSRRVKRVPPFSPVFQSISALMSDALDRMPPIPRPPCR
jgi:hypothetical protein